MANHRFLAAWADREQRRFDEQRAHPMVPGTEPTWARILQGFFGMFAMAVKCVVLPLYLVWTVKLVTLHTIQSCVLAVVIVMLFSISVFTTAHAVQTRKAEGRNWFTGLAPKVRST